MCILHNIASSFHCHMYWLEFQMLLPPVKKIKTGLHKGNTGSQTLDEGLLPKEVDSYAHNCTIADTTHITSAMGKHAANIKTSYDLAALKIK